MANRQGSKQSAASPGAGLDAGKAPSPPSPGPGINAEALQRLVDQAAHFNMFSTPDANGSDAAILAPGGGNSVIGIRVNEVLRRFEVNAQPPTSERPLGAKNVVGEVAGKFTHRWMAIPDDFVAAPGREPPPTALDPSRSQRFVMLDSVCAFGDGKDGFRGFGAGQTFPVTRDGQRQLLAVAIGNVMEGFGRFKGNDVGTYVYCGGLSFQHGFIGNILLRVMDPQGTLRASGSLPAPESRLDPEPGVTYIVFRGEAVPSDAVTPRIGPNGQLQGLNVEQGLRLIHLDFKAKGHGGLQSVARVGQVVGRILAQVSFDPTAPGGTSLDPIPFTTFDEFTFFDREGRTVGGFTGDSSEGRVFNILVGGQKGIRFGGVGRILSGTGPFKGIEGLLTDNSVVIFTPHVSASVYVLRVNDPDGRFRAAINEC
jgi:hypothetical protein